MVRGKTVKNPKTIVSLVCISLIVLSVVPSALAATDMGVTSVGSTSYPTANFGTVNGVSGTNGGLKDILIATKYTLAVSGTVTNIGGYASSAGHWKLGIYSDSGGKPGTLIVANNNANSVAAGDNSVSIGPVYLSAGTYWIAILTDSPNRKYVPSGVTDYITGYGFSNNLPNTFGTPTGEQPYDYVAYATYVQVQGYAKATKITVSSDNTPIASISFYSHATGNYRVAVYSDNSGPNTKLWESPDTTATTGWNVITTAAGSPSSLTLNAGTYWLVYQWNSANAGPSLTTGSSGDGKYMPMAYSTFPATWTGGTVTSQQWSIYLTTGGFIVTPENGLGALVALTACFGGFVAFIGYKKKAKN